MELAVIIVSVRVRATALDQVVVSTILVIEVRIDASDHAVDQVGRPVRIVLAIIVIVVSNFSDCLLGLNVSLKVIHSKELHHIGLKLLVGLLDIWERPDTWVFRFGIKIVKLVTHMVQAVQRVQGCGKVRVMKHLFAPRTTRL